MGRFCIQISEKPVVSYLLFLFTQILLTDGVIDAALELESS